MRRRRMMTVVTPWMLVLAGVGLSAAQSDTGRIDTLTLDRAVGLALEHNPSMRSAMANVDLSLAASRQTLGSYYPALNLTASASHTEGVFVFNPTIPARNQIYSSYSGGLQVSQLLYDFGRTSNRVSANTYLEDASSMDYESTKDLVAMNAELAYFAYLQAEQVERVDEEAVQSAERHLVQAKAFYSVGTRPRLDVTKAEVDLANANVTLITAKNQMRVAKVQLENAMGVHPANEYAVSDSFSIPSVTLTLDSVEAVARARRPDLLSAQARFDAANSLVSAAWSQHLPTLSASGSWTWNGFEPSPLYARWVAGVTLSFPIFQGFTINAQVQQAEANARAASAELDITSESALLDVEQSYLALKEAQERKVATAKLVQQAEENLTLAERQYAAGVGTSLDVSDAQLARSNAHITDIQAFTDYNGALVRLHHAIGLTP